MRTLFLFLVMLATSLTGAEQFSYIYKQGDHTHIRSNSGIEQMVSLSKRWTGEFVWLKRNGRQYLIRDAAVLAQVRAAFADLHAYEPKVRAAEESLRPLERKMERIEERMDELSDRLGDDEELDEATRVGLERKLAQAEREFNELERSYRPAERENERMEREHDRLEKIAEEKFEKIVFRAVEEGKAERVD
jgi:chromosome segregation ATPase